MEDQKLIKTKKIPCNLCGSDECKFLFSARDRLHGCDGIFSYVMCTKCGLVYMNPQISPEEIADFYPENYAPHQSELTKSNRSKKLRNCRIRRKPELAFIWRNLNSHCRLLDIGCGNGKFLYETQKCTGCQVYGVDISQTAVAEAKNVFNLDIFHGTIDQAPFSENYFDFITAWSFIEHVNNPSKVLRKLCSLLKFDSNFVLITPNFDSFNARWFKDKWYHLDCPRHLYIYTPQTITAFLEKNGFVVEKIVHQKSSKGLLGSLQYCIFDNNFSPRHSNKIRRSSLVKCVASPLTRVASTAKKSDVILIYARKK